MTNEAITFFGKLTNFILHEASAKDMLQVFKFRHVIGYPNDYIELSFHNTFTSPTLKKLTNLASNWTPINYFRVAIITTRQ